MDTIICTAIFTVLGCWAFSIVISRLGRKRFWLLVELPEVTGPRLSAAEVKLALENKGEDPAVRALVQLLAMTRADYLKTAQNKAVGAENATYDLGGAAAIEDMLAETLKLIDGQVSDDVKRYFGD